MKRKHHMIAKALGLAMLLTIIVVTACAVKADTPTSRPGDLSPFAIDTAHGVACYRQSYANISCVKL